VHRTSGGVMEDVQPYRSTQELPHGAKGSRYRM
jgi:hypothetical protein